jgi:hypothetical protein
MLEMIEIESISSLLRGGYRPALSNGVYSSVCDARIVSTGALRKFRFPRLSLKSHSPSVH